MSELLLLAVLIAINGFFSASEIAVISVPKLRLKQLIEDGNRTAQVLFNLADDSSRFLATIQIGVTLMGFLASATAAVRLSAGLTETIKRIPIAGLANIAEGLAIAGITIVLALITLVLGELVPKSIGLAHAERIALAVARPIDFMARLAGPLVRFLVWLTNLIAKPFGGRPRRGMPIVTEEEIKTLVDAGEEGGVIEEEEKEMIYSIFEFGDTVAREVMVPRMDMLAVEVETPLLEAMETVINHNHSRVPVYQNSIDNVVGILYAKDLLKVLHEKGRVGVNEVRVVDLLRPAAFTPESKRVNELFEEMQKRRIHMAIVIDEYGGTAGIVTIEDILEEIVGEIQDEYDQAEELEIQPAGENEWLINARANLGDINAALHVHFPAGEADTLGGFIYMQLGKVPLPGDEVRYENVLLKVVNVAGRRIGKVKVQVLESELVEGKKAED
ncbi:MAG TPA: hemolysin family protein [Anaerolineae bacterium]|nr:hemolysin family protein [Anaerolineae bacterium]